MNVENIPELLTQHPHWCVCGSMLKTKRKENQIKFPSK